MKKFLLLPLIVAVCLFLDLGSKHLAETHLASEVYQHSLQLDVAPEYAGNTVADLLGQKLAWHSPEEIRHMADQSTDIVDENGLLLNTGNLSETVLEGGERLRVRHRSINLIDGFLDFRYVENTGAAWGFLSNRDSSFRRPFFIAIGLIAIGVILLLYRSVPAEKTWFLVSLSIILGGALGNIIDRIRLSYVVDFIHVRPGFDYPTFNLADAWIVIGVGMMIIQVIRDRIAERKTKKKTTNKASSAA